MRVYLTSVLGLAVCLALTSCSKKTKPEAAAAAATNAVPVAAPPEPPVVITFRPDDADPLGVRFAADDSPDVRYGPSRRYTQMDAVSLQRGQRVFVMDETNEWIRIRATQEAGPSLGWINKFASLPALDTDTNLLVQEAEVGLLQSVGLVVDVRPEQNEALIRTNAWNGESLAVRRGVGRVLAHYCGLKKGTNTRWVYLTDADSGQRIGRYSENSGYTDFSSLRKQPANK